MQWKPRSSAACAQSHRPVEIAVLLGDGDRPARVPAELIDVGRKLRQRAAGKALHATGMERRIGGAVDIDEIVAADGEAYTHIADRGGKPGRYAAGAGRRFSPDLHLPGIAGIA